jgi:eukaryotic-like serine/threonine-protein kinase
MYAGFKGMVCCGAMVASTETVPSLPQQIGRYEVVGKLASGGMAEILLCRLVGPSGFERPVVIKRILPHLASVPGFTEMFLDEARIVARLRHPNVVHVYELGVEGDELFMGMEYLEGESVAGILRRLLAKGKLMDHANAAAIAAGACSGLHAAHELTDKDGRNLGLVHRDVSPQNIFVTYEGEVKVLDFGIAKSADRQVRTETGMIKGKSSYMSPEQARAKPLDRQSDIFSLGIVLFEMCTMHRLFHRENPLLTFRALCQDPIPPMSQLRSEVPAALVDIGRRALARAPSDRYPTAQDMRRDLLAITRKLNTREPEELLARMMQELFPERMAEKHELRRQVEQGTAVGRMPPPETDVGISLPNAGQETEHDELQTSAAPALPIHRRHLWMLVAGLVAVGVLALVATVTRREVPTLGTAASDASTAVRPLEQPPATAALSQATRVVAIDLQTKPPGARIVVWGEERGRTPLRLTLPQSADFVLVDVTLDGYVPQRVDVRPDVDQRLVLTMDRPPLNRQPAASGSGANGTPPPSPSALERPRRVAPSASQAPNTPPSDFHRFD